MKIEDIKVGDKIEIVADMIGLTTYRVHVTKIRKNSIHGKYRTLIYGDWQPIHDGDGMFIKGSIQSIKLINLL